MHENVKILAQLQKDMKNNQKQWITDCIKVGDFTYADTSISVRTWGEGSKLYIGKFCSIAANVQFLLGGEHHGDWCTTYPFNVLAAKICNNNERVAKTKGDIIIGNDVWIGNDATILSGVTIGDGAIIANKAVVTKNVLPYEVVGGVAAKHLKWRFDFPKIKEIHNLQWWDWPLDKLATALSILCSNNYDELIQFHKNWQGA